MLVIVLSFTNIHESEAGGPILKHFFFFNPYRLLKIQHLLNQTIFFYLPSKSSQQQKFKVNPQRVYVSTDSTSFFTT